jgi:hypothetical protein
MISTQLDIEKERGILLFQLDIKVEEKVSLSALQRNRLLEAGFKENHICAKTKKEVYDKLLILFISIYKKLGIHSDSIRAGTIGHRETVKVLAFFSYFYLAEFCDVSIESLSRSTFQKLVTNLLNTYEPDASFDPVLKKSDRYRKSLNRTDEVFLRGEMELAGKVSLLMSAEGGVGSPGYTTLKRFQLSALQHIREYERNKSIVEDLDLELKDILHNIELLDSEKSKHTELKTNRLERRRAKDTCELLKPLVDWYAEGSLMKKVEKVLTAIKDVERVHGERVYTYKSDRFRDEKPIAHKV